MQTTKPNNILYTASLILPILATLGNILGGWWTYGVILVIILLTIPDIFWKFPNKEPLGQELEFNNILLVALVIINTLSLFSLLYGIREQILLGASFWVAIISTSISMGAIGNMTAHELIHRRGWIRNLGIWNLFLVSYTHYVLEHIQFHHRYVATDMDPSTAKKDEDFYTFMARMIPEQFWEVYKYERENMAKKSKGFVSWDNFLIKSWVAKFVFLVLVFVYSGWLGILSYLLVCLISRMIHDSITYSQHYGTKRELNGKITIMHSWQSNSFVSEYFSLGLIRHSDHHIHATATYPNLTSYETAPTLPLGYMAVLPLIWIPPLWFKMANPVLDKIENTSQVI
jgi:alkane 1-monooxygenase